MSQPIATCDLADGAVDIDPVIARVVSDRNLKVAITSNKGDYEFHIYTERAAKDADQDGLRRTYALIELSGHAKMVETWGRLDIPAMIRIFSNLLAFSDYAVTRVASDWTVTCPECGHVETGKHYEPQPRACKSAKSAGCSMVNCKTFVTRAQTSEAEEPL